MSMMDFDPLRYSRHMERTLVPELEARYGDLNQSNFNYPHYPGDRVDFRRKVNASNDGKFSFTEAIGNLAKGVVSPITETVDMMTSSVGGFLKGSAMIGAGVGIVMLGGAPLLLAGGAIYGAYQFGKGALNLVTARDGDEAEKAFYNMGTGIGAVGLSALGARSALTSAASKGATGLKSADDLAQMSRLETLRYALGKENLLSVWNSFKSNFQAFKQNPGAPIASTASGTGATAPKATVNSTGQQAQTINKAAAAKYSKPLSNPYSPNRQTFSRQEIPKSAASSTGTSAQPTNPALDMKVYRDVQHELHNPKGLLKPEVIKGQTTTPSHLEPLAATD